MAQEAPRSRLSEQLRRTRPHLPRVSVTVAWLWRYPAFSDPSLGVLGSRPPLTGGSPLLRSSPRRSSTLFTLPLWALTASAASCSKLLRQEDSDVRDCRVARALRVYPCRS